MKEQIENPELARRLTVAMEKEGMTARELAELSGVSPQAVYNWRKTGKIYRERIPELARLLHVSSDWLHTGRESGSVAETVAAYDGLSEEEARHLRHYRRLTQDQRDALNALLRTFTR